MRLIPTWALVGLGAVALLFSTRKTIAMTTSKPSGSPLSLPPPLPAWKQSAQAQKYLPMLNATEIRYGLPRDLLARQAYQESRFREDIITGKVVSSAGAVGIMQIIPKWHPEIDPGDAAADRKAALDPARAADYAAKFLVRLKSQFGSWSLALAAYNAGPGKVQEYGGIPPYTETRNYVAQITADVPAALA